MSKAKATPEPESIIGNTYIYNTERGKQLFELSNHLGNVLVTISDKKLGQDTTADGISDYYDADIVKANDYYPFGMLMPGRKYSASDLYRYGFNGKENDNDVKGEGNQQDYGMRIYDPRLGKFLSLDPLQEDYPELTPYQFASNTPVEAIDLDGLEKYYYARSVDNKGSAVLTLIKTGPLVETKQVFVGMTTPRSALPDPQPIFKSVTTVNQRQEYIVYSPIERPITRAGNVTWETYQGSATFNSYDAASKSTNSDYKLGFGDFLMHYAVQGFINVGEEFKEGNVPGSKRASSNTPSSNTNSQTTAANGGNKEAANQDAQYSNAKTSTLEPGPHAAESIPARGTTRKFTTEERNKIHEIGKKSGCHTCGSTEPKTKSGNFISDHQPANQLNANGVPQSLYPHCLNCSRQQGERLGQPNKKEQEMIYHHKNVEIIYSGSDLVTIGLRRRLGSELMISTSNMSVDGYFNLISFIIDYVNRSSAIIKTGNTFAYGIWMLKFLSKDAYLEVYELDEHFKYWNAGAQNAVTLIEEQRKICIDNNTESFQVSVDQSIALSEGVLIGEPLQGIRYHAPDHMSGWYLTSASYNGEIETLQVLKLYDIIPQRREFLKYLFLPPGFVFEINSMGDASVWFEKEVASEKPE